MEKNIYYKLNKNNSDVSRFKVHFDSECVVCNNKERHQFIGYISEHEYSNTTSIVFPVFRCPNCQLTYLYPRPDISELQTIYPSDYYTYNLSDQKFEESPNDSKPLKNTLVSLNINSYNERISPFINVHDPVPTKILDIGCGDGAQLNKFKKFIPNCETHGVDIDKTSVEKARSNGHNAYYGRFEDVKLPKKFFDLVYSIHVIEHVERPDIFLERCLSLLSPNGILLIETPNTDAIDYYMFKKKHWGGYHPPRHWYLFNIKTFHHLAKRFNAEIVAFSPYSTGVFWNWTCHSLCKSIFGKKTADRIFPPISIFYGGMQSFVLLTFFSIIEKISLTFFRKANAMWIVLKNQPD